MEDYATNPLNAATLCEFSLNLTPAARSLKRLGNAERANNPYVRQNRQPAIRRPIRRVQIARLPSTSQLLSASQQRGSGHSQIP